MKTHLLQSFNVMLRLGTHGTRFALVFVSAKYLTENDLGYYGLFTAALGYALLSFGLDLYVYTTREFPRYRPERQGLLIKSHAALVAVIYVVLSPLMLLVLPYADLPNFLIWWFFPILILEHINQELYRLLIMLFKQVQASVLLFLRQGSWALTAAGLMLVDEGSRSLNFLILQWAVSGLVAVAAGVWTVHKQKLSGWQSPIDWPWIRRGVVVSASFLVATLALSSISTFDRYWLNSLAGPDMVGAYVLFIGVASTLNVFLGASIFEFRYPELVSLGRLKDRAGMRAKIREMTILVAAISVAFALISFLFLPFLLGWIGRSIYSSRMDLYGLVLAATVAHSLSMAPHYGLYALGRDRDIIAGHLIALIIFAVTTWCAAHISTSNAVPVGVLVAMTSVLVWKTAAYLRAFQQAPAAEC